MSIWLFTWQFLHFTVLIDCSQLLSDVSGIFLDISNKVLYKMWHGGLLFQLKTYGAKGELLNLLRNYLNERNQRVVFNGQISP